MRSRVAPSTPPAGPGRAGIGVICESTSRVVSLTNFVDVRAAGSAYPPVPSVAVARCRDNVREFRRKREIGDRGAP